MDTNSKVGGCGKQDSVAKHDGQPGTLLRSTTARNFAGAVVTKKVVGLGEFVNKESLKVVSMRI